MTEPKKAEKKPKMMMNACRVEKDGEVVFEGTQNDSFKFIHDAQPKSVHLACAQDGWKLIELEPEGGVK